MGCSFSAISNDTDDWEDFKRLTNLPQTPGIDMYSDEARALKQIHQQFGFKGQILLNALGLCQAHWAQIALDKADQEERKLYQKLKEKYEK